MPLSEIQQKSANAHTLVRAVGGFPPIGTAFTITNYEFVVNSYKDKDGVEKQSSKPMFTTSLQDTMIDPMSAVATVAIIPFVDDQGRRVTCCRCEGTFHDELREIFRTNRTKSNIEVLQMAVDAFKDRELVVTSVVYHEATGKYGPYLRPFVNISFKAQ